MPNVKDKRLKLSQEADVLKTTLNKNVRWPKKEIKKSTSLQLSIYSLQGIKNEMQNDKIYAEKAQ